MAAAREALKEPPLSPAVAHVFGWWLELASHRGVGFAGPAPLTWSDLDAWSRLMRVSPTPWEWTAIAAIDRAFLAASEPPKPKT
jgi:hypothetical protein